MRHDGNILHSRNVYAEELDTEDLELKKRLQDLEKDGHDVIIAAHSGSTTVFRYVSKEAGRLGVEVDSVRISKGQTVESLLSGRAR